MPPRNRQKSDRKVPPANNNASHKQQQQQQQLTEQQQQQAKGGGGGGGAAAAASSSVRLLISRLVPSSSSSYSPSAPAPALSQSSSSLLLNSTDKQMSVMARELSHLLESKEAATSLDELLYAANALLASDGLGIAFILYGKYANSGLKQTLSKIIAHLGLQLCTLNTADETSYGLWKQELPQSPQQQETISAPPPPPSPPLLTIQEYQSEYFNRIFSLVTTQSSDTPIEVKYCLLEGLNEMFTVPQAKSIPPSILEFVIQHFLRVVDSTETPEILPKLVEAMRSLATTHKNIFLPHFKRAFDLIIGWCMDPVTPRSLSQPLEETLKKMYSFLRQDGNMGFCMEILSSIIDDIEKCADVACFKCVSSSTNDNPHIAHSVPPPRLNDRCSETRATEKMPADVFVFFNCAISLFYALFAALPSDTSAASIAKTLSSTSSSSSAFTSSFSSSSSNSFPSLDDRLKLESLTIWMLEIIVHIGLKYEDRRWISLGKQFLACIHKFKRLHTMVAAQTASSTSSLSTLIFQYIVRFHEFELAWSLEDDGFSKTEKSILDILKSGNGHAFEGDEDLFKDAQKWICHVKDTLGIWGLNSNILVSVDKNTSPSTGTTTSIPQHNPLDTLRINLSLSIAPLFINPFIKSGILLLIRRDLMASYCCNFNGFNASFECEYLDLVLTILSGLPSTSMSRMAAGSINADLGVWSLFQEIIEIIIFISQQKLGSSITTPSFSNMLASIESRSLAFDSSSSNTSNSIETTTGSTSTTTSAAAPHQPSIELLKSIIVFNIRLIKECSKFNILMNTTENKNVPINVIVGKILSELLLCMSSSALSPVSSVSSLSVDSDWRSLQDVLLSEMLAMCSSIDFFLLTDDTVSSPTDSKDTLINYSCDIIRCYLGFMTRFLHPEEAYDNRMLALGWIKSLLLQLGKNGLEMDGINDVLEGCVFLIIENMGESSDPLVRRMCAELLQVYVENYGMTGASEYFDNQTNARIFLSSVFERIHDTDMNVKAATQNLITALSGVASKAMLGAFQNSSSSKVLKSMSALMSVPHSGAFRAQHFQIWFAHLGMEHLIQGSSRDDYNDTAEDYLIRLYHSCQSDCLLYSHGNPPPDVAVFDISNELINFWANWEAARYCILARLRTPLGSPQQTLENIESFLKSVIVVGNDPSSFDIKFDDLLCFWKKIRILLQFIDLLEIHLMNAIQNTTANIMPTTPPAAAIFFETNKSVCVEWLIRLRKFVVFGAHVSGMNAAFTVRHGLSYLSESLTLVEKGGWLPTTSSNSEDLSRVIFFTVDALMKLNDADSILAVLSLYRRSFQPLVKASSDFDFSGEFLECAVLMSEDLYERALDKLLILSEKCPAILRDAFSNLLLRIYRAVGTDQDDRIQDLSTTTHLPLLSSWDIPLSDGKNEDAGRLVDMIESNKSKACFAIGLKPSIEARIQSILSFYPGVETINAKLLDVTKHTGLELMESVSSDLCEDSLALLKQLSMCREIEAAHNSASFLKKGAMMGISTDEGVDIAGLSHQLRLLRILSSYKFETSNTRLPAMAHPSLNSLLDIKCSLSRLARKSGNLNLSKKVLTGKHDASFGILYERSKLAHSCGKLDQSVSLLLPYFESQASLVREAVGSNSTAITLSHGFSCIPKSLICIAKWSHSLSNEIYQRAFDVLKTATVDEGGLFADKSVFGIDLDSMEKPIATRSLSNLALELAVQGFPLNARAWYDYANYFYIQGREILEKIVISISSNEHFVELVPLILEEGGEKKTADVHNIHWSLRNVFLHEMGELGEALNTQDSMQLETRLVNLFPWCSQETLQKSVDCVRIVQKSIFTNFERSLYGSFRFLQLSGGGGGDSSKTKSKLLTSTLRILRLLIKYGLNVSSSFSENLKCCSTDSWETIIPQLFARLDHPDAFVRKEVCDLISRIGVVSPSKVVYHTVVGSLSQKMTESATFESAYSNIINSMKSSGSANLLWEVERMVVELQRITVLWDEKWFNKLSSLEPDALKRIERIQLESSRATKLPNINNNPHHQRKSTAVSIKGFAAIVAPLVSLLRPLVSETIMALPTSPFEHDFQLKFKSKILDALSKLEVPSASDAKCLEDAWNSFKEIKEEIGRHIHKARQFSMSSLSPYLAECRESSIPMPGLPIFDSLVKIGTFDNVIIGLPTKTKPKKITIMSSNGRKYPYLLKGLEDLHLDERVMQFVNTVNTLLQIDKETQKRQLQSRAYAVIPFGDHFGMIQWVNDMTPMFSFYKKWMSSTGASAVAATAATTSTSGGGGKNGTSSSKKNKAATTAAAAVVVASRPNESFYIKVKEALKQLRLAKNTPRKNWPLKKIFAELVEETPDYLFENELRCSSATPHIWYQKSQRFSRTLAVMSMIGYIIGLGDRHLDNMLLDRESGEILHIDFNVCFEKGRRLRVPETVPFRLSQNLDKVAAGFGRNSEEGVFGMSCRHTLRVMRESKEILLTLLEAFVYDPLVDWKTTEQASDRQKRRAEFDVNARLLLARVDENGGLMIEHHFSNIQTHLSQAALIFNAMETVETKRKKKSSASSISSNSSAQLSQQASSLPQRSGLLEKMETATLRGLSIQFGESVGMLSKLLDGIAVYLDLVAQSCVDDLVPSTRPLLESVQKIQKLWPLVNSSFKLLVDDVFKHCSWESGEIMPHAVSKLSLIDWVKLDAYIIEMMNSVVVIMKGEEMLDPHSSNSTSPTTTTTTTTTSIQSPHDSKGELSDGGKKPTVSPNSMKAFTHEFSGLEIGEGVSGEKTLPTSAATSLKWGDSEMMDDEDDEIAEDVEDDDEIEEMLSNEEEDNDEDEEEDEEEEDEEEGEDGMDEEKGKTSASDTHTMTFAASPDRPRRPSHLGTTSTTPSKISPPSSTSFKNSVSRRKKRSVSGGVLGGNAPPFAVSKVQERNLYAVNALKRVKSKLDGTDFGLIVIPPPPSSTTTTTVSTTQQQQSQQRMGISEQVIRTIREAKNPNNLAVMYEGWMGWI